MIKLMKRTALPAAIAVSLSVMPSLAQDAESLETMQAKVTGMQKQMEAMEARLEDQESKVSKLPALDKAVQVYGQARVSVDTTDKDVGSDGTEIRSNASRIGVKGEMETTLADTILFYQTELRYELTDETDGVNTKEIEFREGFAGLKSGWGKMRFGRLAVGYKNTGTKIDPWTDNAPQARGGGRQGMSELHSSYINNAADYETPAFAGFTANAWYSTRFDDSATRIYNSGASRNYIGGNAGGVGVKYEAGPLYVGADWLDIDAGGTTNGVANDAAWQIAARLKVMKNLSFAALYEDTEDIGLGKNWYVNGIYRMGKTRLIAAYGESNDRVANSGTDPNRDWSNWSLGAKYDLTKKSEILVAWNHAQDDTTDNDVDTVTVGINAKFGY